MAGENAKVIDVLAIKELMADKIKLVGIPTSDPGVAGQLWSNSGVLTISAG